MMMENNIPNSRKLNRNCLSLVEEQFEFDFVLDQQDQTFKKHPLVSKSLRSLFTKIRGTSQIDNVSHSSGTIKLPIIEESNYLILRRKTYNTNRHTLDLSNIGGSFKRSNSLSTTVSSSLSSSFSDDAYQVQKRIWDEDTSICPKEEIAEYLGSPSRSDVLNLYMNNFNFSNQSLDYAFRILCNKLYLKAEAQQLDRIIQVFAKRYFECNPTTAFHSIDVIHTIAYSLLLLNTDLHIVNEKMSKSCFIKNTIETIQFVQFPHLRPTSLHLNDAHKSTLSRKSYLLDGLTDSQKSWLLEIEHILKEMYTSVKLNRINSIYQSTRPPLLQPAPKPEHEKFYRHGLVMRKHVMESIDKRARHRQWQLCYMVITETEMILYKPILMNKRKILFHQKLKDMIHYHWQPDKDHPSLTLKLNHAYATPIPPPGWNRQRPHTFRLETADGGLWLFESVDLFAVKAWVEACNLTAAKISKGLLPGAICNIDYGWGAKWNDSKEITNVPVWYPPTPCMVNSHLDLEDQYLDIKQQIQKLNMQLDKHRVLKLSVDKRFSSGYENSSMNSMQALSNWDKKLHYLLHEIIKLKCYKDALQTQLAFYNTE